MSGDWIKVQVSLSRKPEVIAMSARLGVDRFAIVGRLVEVWGWFDEQTSDGFCHAVTVTNVDDLARMDHFADAMLSVGWLHVSSDPPGLFMPRFDRHNGKSSKNRALAAERQSRSRDVRHDITVTEVTQGGSKNRDQRREEKIDQEKSQKHVQQAARFDEFWSAYPIKRGKKTARDKWRSKKLDAVADQLLADVRRRVTEDQQWRDGFAPHASTYLHQERWEDELAGRAHAAAPSTTPKPAAHEPANPEKRHLTPEQRAANKKRLDELLPGLSV